MGGSFGGYMANWVAGHTDRFEAIVTHASLWALDQFGADHRRRVLVGARDDAGDGRARTPRTGTSARSAPRCWSSTATRTTACRSARRCGCGTSCSTESGLPAADDGTSPHRFLYFPSENHWVLSPQHAKIWYQVVTAFLARHVLGEDVELPETLG